MLTPDIEAQIREAMAAQSIFCPIPLIADGKIYRFANKRIGKSNCWVAIHSNHYNNEYFYVSIFGDWRRNSNYSVFRSNNYCKLPRSQKNQFDLRVAEAREKARIEKASLQEQAAQKARVNWEKFRDSGESAYLKRKRVGGHGIKYADDFIVIPIRTISGEMVSYQLIYNDGTKIFFPGGRKRGCFHVIGAIEDADRVLICEGYATGATLFENTNMPAVVAFDVYNLEPVVAELRKKN